jgi:hypothetical protein
MRYWNVVGLRDKAVTDDIEEFEPPPAEWKGRAS